MEDRTMSTEQDQQDTQPQGGEVDGAEALAAHSAAVRAAFDEENPPYAPARPAAARSEEKPPAAETDESPAKAATDDAPAEPDSSEEVVDPYAGVPQAVRDRLAVLGDLEHQFKSASGRIGALQRKNEEMARELAALRAARAAPETPAEPKAPARPKLDAVRNELPEVADAIEEALAAREEERARQQQAAPTAPQAAAQPEADPLAAEMDALNTARPTWQQDIASTDFKLWLTQQPSAYAETVRTTDRALVMHKALQDFDTYRTRVQPRNAAATEVEQRRTQRAAAAIQPRGNGGRPPPGGGAPTFSDLVRQGFNEAL